MEGSCNMNIGAGIVTFNPDIVRLTENISAISPQVKTVLVVDNGSDNSCKISTLCSNYSNVSLQRLNSNEGIAKALNVIMARFKELGYDYVVTLDQDSVSTPGMVDILLSSVDEDSGIVAPQIIDRNKSDFTNWDGLLDHETVQIKQAARKGVITSGALTSVRAWDFVGGFDDIFFIDYVDYDFNKRLLLEGFSIVRNGNAGLIHEVGKASPTPLFTPRKAQNGKWHLERFYSFGHSPFRCYYKSRNRFLYSKKYLFLPGFFSFEGVFQIFPQICLTLLFEDHRYKKLKAFCSGMKDGFNLHVNRYVVKKGQ